MVKHFLLRDLGRNLSNIYVRSLTSNCASLLTVAHEQYLIKYAFSTFSTAPAVLLEYSEIYVYVPEIAGSSAEMVLYWIIILTSKGFAAASFLFLQKASQGFQSG